MNNLRVVDMADNEKPVEKALMYGIDSLSDAELLAIIIKCGTKEHSAIQLAQLILNKDPVYKGIVGLNYLSLDDLTSIPGIGKMKAAQIIALTEISRRMSRNSFKDSLKLKDPKSIADYYMEKVRYLTREKVYVLYLSSALNLLSEEQISEGTIDRSLVSAGEVFKKALRLNASCIILIHNHPSGDPTPSEADISVTKKLIKTGEMLGIIVVDHIIIGDKKYFSIAERGYINEN